MSALMLWGNVRLQRGAMFAGDVILRADDPYRLMDRYVHEEKRHQGFDGEEMIFFFVNSGLRFPADLDRVQQLTAAVKQTFGPSVLSLAEIPAYRDTGDALDDTPYITPQQLAAPNFRLREWQARAAQDPGVFGVFVGRDFAWASVVRYLPPGHDEIHEFRNTVEFLEGRHIPWWEWFWKTDITPQDAAVGVGGWVMGRGLLDQGLNVDMLTLVFLGVGLTFPLFWVLTGSWRFALLAVLILIGGGFVWTRGWMGLIGMRERVFSVLAYANVVVQGTSFALHKFAAFAESRGDDRVTRWTAATHVDYVIATTTGIALFGFLTLYTFDLAPIRELGLASACGVVWLLVLALGVLPALDLLWGNAVDAPLHSTAADIRTAPSQTMTDRLMGRYATLVLWCATGARPWLIASAVMGLFLVVALLFVSGWIESRTRALTFIRGTSVERQARYLNQDGNVGFEFLDVLVEPAQGQAGLTDPVFLTRAWAYQHALRSLPDARETASILSSVARIAEESLKKPFPTTREEIDAAFTLIESRLAPTVQRQFYFPGGVRVSVSYGFDDSVRLGRFCDAALTLARRDFPDLKVSTFNTVPIYPRADLYVRQGKVWNVFSSQLGVALICAGVLAWRNRRRTWRLAPLWGGLAMSAPLFFATGVIGLLMWGLAIPLDIATASIGALCINAATDFSLYLALAYQTALQERPAEEALAVAVQHEGTIIVADCLLNIVCFLPLVASRFAPIADIGWMMAVMLVACAAGTFLVMAPLLPRCVRTVEAPA
jgi:predicted RND superfamily exporter protein